LHTHLIFGGCVNICADNDTMASSSLSSSSPPSVTVDYDIDSDKYKQIFNDSRKKLLRSIDPTPILINAISFSEQFASKLDGIKSQPTTTEKALTILTVPIGENTEMIKSFISLLNDSDHKHVADVFIKKSSEHLLSDDRYELLMTKLVELQKYLDPECGILDELITRGVFSLSDKETVDSVKIRYHKVNKIVEILSRKTNSDFDQFVNILHEVGQEHVVYVLTENRKGSPPMNDAILTLLSKRRKVIIDSMESVNCPLLSEMESLGVFTPFDKQRVEGEGNINWRRNEQILYILQRKPERIFPNFLKSLRNTKQGHVLRRYKAHAYVHAETTNSTPVEGTTDQIVVDVVRKDQCSQNDNPLSKTLKNIGVEATDVAKESTKIKFTLFTESSLEQLRSLLSSRELDRLFTETYCPQLVHTNIKSLRVEIADGEFERCRKEMAQPALMTPEHQTALELAQEKIADKIEVDEDLLKRLSLCKYRTQAILGSEDKARVLLDVMARRPDSEFQEFVEALRNTGQTEAVKFLSGFTLY